MTRLMENSKGFSVRSIDIGRQECCVIILRRAGMELLVPERGPGAEIPTIYIPQQQRVAESVTHAVQEQLEIAVYCLFVVTVPSSKAGSRFCVAVESRDNDQAAPEQCHWILVEHLSNESFREGDFAIVEAAIREMRSYAEGLAIGPFGKPGWIEDLVRWVEGEVSPLGIRLGGDIRQFNASPTFALLRFETNGKALWFKAVGEPNLHEPPIIAILSRNLPAFVPELIAVHPFLNGWLAAECEGLTLAESTDGGEWRHAAITLATLQIESAKISDQLIEAGCRDSRINKLLEQVDPFLASVARLMERQEKPLPPAMNCDQLDALGVCIKQAATVWTLLNIPDTLGNLDFNPGNIVISGERCVFLDWAEAYVGPPFLTFELLRAHLEQTSVASGSLNSQLSRNYADVWTQFLSSEVVAEGWELSKLLAPFAYATGTSLWRDEQALLNPSVAGYLRSLTRRMQRESQRLQERRLICLNP